MAALWAPPEAVSAFLRDERSHREGHPPLARLDDGKRLANAAGAGAPAYVRAWMPGGAAAPSGAEIVSSAEYPWGACDR
jgi:hypothetical protein